MSYNLFLDDLRSPADAYLHDERKSLFEKSFVLNWEVVRSYDEFKAIIDARGIPDIVSFDHDLHFEHVRHYAEQTILTGMIEYENFVHKTGKHCAELLVKRVKDGGHLMPICYVHSANEIGRREIYKVLSL